jgi:hypothetical protein
VETKPVRARPAETSAAGWQSSSLPQVPALAGGGVFSEAAGPASATAGQSWSAAEGDDDLDDDDIAMPRQRGRMVVLVTALVTAALGVALGNGWRPPTWWRQSRVWHTLHLPYAITAPVTDPAQQPPPGTTPTGDQANPAATGESPSAALPAVIPATDAGSADTAPARDDALSPSGLPDAQTARREPPSTEGRSATAATRRSTRQGAATNGSDPTAAKQSDTPVKDSDATTAREGKTTLPDGEAAKDDATATRQSARQRRRARENNRDVVWSDKLQKLVPVEDEPGPPSAEDRVPRGTPLPTPVQPPAISPEPQPPASTVSPRASGSPPTAP